MSSRSKIEVALRWLATGVFLAMFVFICILNSQPAEKSSSLSVATSEAVLGAAESIDPESVRPTAELVKFVPGAIVIQPLGLGVGFRKLAHTCEFFALGLVGVAASTLWVRRICGVGARRAVAYTVAVAMCAFCSLADQTHRLFVPGREFDFGDLGYDAAGYLLACLVALVLCLVFSRIARHGLKGESYGLE